MEYSIRNLAFLGRITVCLVCIQVSGCDRQESGKDGSRSSGHDGTGGRESSNRRRASDRSASHRALEEDLSKALESPFGEARDSELFRLFKKQPDSCAEILMELAVERKDASIARSLGRCFGQVGNGSWVNWLNEHLQGEYLTMARLGYAEGLASVSPKAALSYIKAMSPGDEKDRVTGAVVLALSKGHNPEVEETMFQWIESSSGQKWGKNPVVLEVIAGILASSDPKEIEKILFQERFIKLGNDSGGEIAGLIAAKDPLLAVRWSLALKSLLERQGAIVSVLGYQMDHQGDAAAMNTIELAAKAIPRKNLLRAVVDIKAREDPVLAAAWIRQQPDDKPNRELYTTLVGVWYQQDGIAASSWVGELPPGKGRDSAAQALVLAVQESDVSSAISWGAAIQDDDMRQRTLSQIKDHQSVERIRQTIQALGSSVRLSEADLKVLLNNGEPGN